jgi:hypothetical protein
MFAYFVSPGSLCVVVGSAPVRYSMTAVSDSSPLADEKAAAAPVDLDDEVEDGVRLGAAGGGNAFSVARYATSSTAREAR